MPAIEGDQARSSHRPSNSTGARVATGLLLWAPVAMAMLLPVLAAVALFSQGADSALAAPAHHPKPQPSVASDDQASGFPSSTRFRALAMPVRYWSDHILRWSAEYGLDPELIAVLMQIESCGHPTVVSSSGALGLFQVMPYHFDAEEDPTDPDTNARRGLSYLTRSLELAEGDTDRALAGYNGGHGVLALLSEGWPGETQRFVRWGGGILRDLQRGDPKSATLQEWLAAGGSSLCRRAASALGIHAD